MISHTGMDLISDSMLLEGDAAERTSYGIGKLGYWLNWAVHTELSLWFTLSGPMCSVACGLICVVDKPWGKQLAVPGLDVHRLFKTELLSMDALAMVF